jgi:hypothetical protein
MAARLVDHLGGAVPADIVESAQRPLLIAQHQDRLARNLDRHERAALHELIGAAGHQPGAAKNAAALQGIDVGVEVPRAGNGAGAGQRPSRIEGGELVVERWHGKMLLWLLLSPPGAAPARTRAQAFGPNSFEE